MSDRVPPVESRPEDTILSGFVSLGGGVILARLVAFVGTAYLARTLGSYGFGIVGFAMALTTFLGVGLRSAFEPVGAREVARNPAIAGRLAAGVGLMRLGLAAIAMSLLALSTAWLDKPFEIKLVVILWSFNLLPLAVDTRWTYRGLGRNRWVGISMVLAQVIHVACLLMLVRGSGDLVWVPLSMLAGETVAAAYLLLPLLRGKTWRPDVAGAGRVLKSSGFLVASGLLGAMMRTTDFIIVALILGESEVGFYSAAYRLTFLVMAIAVALQSAYLPRLARAAQDSLELTRRLTTRAFEFAAALAFPIAIGGWILARPLMVRLFGQQYAAADGALRYLLLAMGLFFFNGLLLQLTVAFDRTRPEIVIRAFAALVNLGLNLLWIPRLGIEGAALATLVSELLVTLLRRSVCRGAGLETGFGFLGRPLLAAILMAAVMLGLARALDLWWVTFVGGALSYLAALTALGGLPKDLRN